MLVSMVLYMLNWLYLVYTRTAHKVYRVAARMAQSRGAGPGGSVFVRARALVGARRAHAPPLGLQGARVGDCRLTREHLHFLGAMALPITFSTYLGLDTLNCDLYYT